MAGFSGRNHRSGKRAGGGSSFFSVASVVVFLAFCLLAVWIFSSSSSSSSSVPSRVRQVAKSHHDSVPAFDDKPDESTLTRSRRDQIRDTETEEEKRREVEEEERKPEIENDGEPETKPDAGDSGKERETNSDGGDSKEQRQTEANLDGGESQQQQEMSSNGGDSQQTETSTDGGESQTSSEGGDSQQSKQEEMETNEIRPRNEGESEEKKEPEVSQDEESSNNEGSEHSQKQEDESPQQSGEAKVLETNEAGTGAGSGSESSEEKKPAQKDGGSGGGSIVSHHWELCNASAGADYIPCLDNEKALKTVRITGHYEHRERHCPEEGPKCLVPLPNGYRHSIEWPTSRNKIWYRNVPHTKLAEVKGHQNWVKVTGDHLTFPGGGTQFIHGALHYIDFVQKAVPRIAWGKHTRVILDVGCGVASLGGYLFDRDVLTMSFAPKDEHTAQVQFALERGIPAISAVMGTQRLPYPSGVFDIVHCARCRVPWHVDGGRLLLELNRVLRPGGYFVWSATPVYQKLQEDVEIWKAMSALTKSICWDLITIKKDKINSVGAAIYRKPVSNDCYNNRDKQEPPMCKEEDDANAAWYVPLQSCLHKVPVRTNQRGTKWPVDWPKRLQTPPYWLNNTEMGIYGKPAAKDFTADLEHWKRVVNKSYLNGMDINWAKVRNVMDMKAAYGGFAAAMKDLSIWVMNVVNIDSQDTLPIIYERGLFGIYHDWCESFSTYPRTYDLLHADHLFSGLKKRCDILPVIVEVDRIVRPGGKVIIRDEPSTVSEVENLLKSLHWDVRLTFTKGNEGILCAEKSDWRPETFSSSS